MRSTYSLDDTPEDARGERGGLEQSLNRELLLLAESPRLSLNERGELQVEGVGLQAQNRFGLELLGHLAAAHPDKNVLISPLSLWSCGVWLQNGAVGATKAGLRRAFAMDDQTSDEKWNAQVNDLSALLKQQPGAEFCLANALWSEAGYVFDADFERISRRYFDAVPATLDFKQPEHAAQIINDWIAAQTKGKIPQMVTADTINSASMVLANALYFKAEWKIPFDPELTQPATFTAADGNQESVLMMSADELKVACAETLAFQAARLPYADTSCALWAILPAVGTTPLDALKLWSQQAPTEYWEERINLKMPRFSLNFSDDLTNHLAAMGAAEAFQSGADFSKLGAPNLYVDSVLHRTRLEIDEKGTVAAAATVVKMSKCASNSINLIFNRPFALVLSEETSRAPLFTGIVNTLAASQS